MAGLAACPPRRIVRRGVSPATQRKNMAITESPERSLWRLKTELRAYTSNVAAELHQHGMTAAPWGLLAFAKWLTWNGHKFDRIQPPSPHETDRGPSMEELGEEIRRAVLPYCAPQCPAPTPTFIERIARLETDCANLRDVLANRKGEGV